MPHEPGRDGADGTKMVTEKKKQVPRGFDVYRLKGIAGRLFSLPPMGLRLMWETGEWDPVGGEEDDGGWSCSEDDELVVEHSGEGRAEMEGGDVVKSEEVGREEHGWVTREVELVDGTREAGFWIEGRAARVRVELR